MNKDILLDVNNSNNIRKLNYVNLVVNTSKVLNSDMYETKSPAMLLTSDFPTATLGGMTGMGGTVRRT
tara:strand:- start:246 stop:449 length:204 start_codon:yes stop_codon:yes gene_type:complete